MSRIGFIGTGHIAAPMARFLAARGHQIHVTERNRRVSADLAATIGATVGDVQGVLDHSDIVFLCLRPEVAESVLAPLAFRADQQIVSVMAGVTRATLSGLCAPATDMVQTLPLGALETGGCPLPAFGNTALLARLFAPDNPVIPVQSDAALGHHLALTAFVPGLLDLMASGAHWLGAQTGDPDGAEFYIRQLMIGFLCGMDQAPGSLARERDALANEGTYSLQMVEILRQEGAHEALATALAAIKTRLETQT